MNADGKTDLLSSSGSTTPPIDEGTRYVALARCQGAALAYGYGCAPVAPAPTPTLSGCLEVGHGVTLRVQAAPSTDGARPGTSMAHR